MTALQKTALTFYALVNLLLGYINLSLTHLGSSSSLRNYLSSLMLLVFVVVGGWLLRKKGWTFFGGVVAIEIIIFFLGALGVISLF